MSISFEDQIALESATVEDIIDQLNLDDCESDEVPLFFVDDEE